MKKFYFVLVAIATTLAICATACSESPKMNEFEINTTNLDLSKSDKLCLLKDVASIITNAEDSKFVFDFAEMAVKETDRYECVYMDNLINFSTRSKNNLATLMLDEINMNRDKYSSIFDGTITRGDVMTLDELQNLEVEFYVPYSDNFEDIPEYITVGYHPLVQEDWTDGYQIGKDGTTKYVSYIDDEYAQQNLTVIVMPKESDETSGDLSLYDGVSTFVYVDPQNPNISVVPDTQSLPNGLIKENITDSNIIDEDDVLYTCVSALRVDGTDWMKFLQTKMRLAIYRASSDVVWKDGICEESGATFHKTISLTIPRKDCRDGVWYKRNMVFDDDWDLHETNQKIYFVTEHNFAGDISLNANVGIGIKNGKPYIDPTSLANVSIELNNGSILRVHNELIRKAVLANNVGDIGGGTRTIDDTQFAVRGYGIVDLVFTFNYTKIN